MVKTKSISYFLQFFTYLNYVPYGTLARTVKDYIDLCFNCIDGESIVVDRCVAQCSQIGTENYLKKYVKYLLKNCHFELNNEL